MDIRKGQKVWICIYQGRTSKIEETIIEAVGRRYITVEACKKKRFFKNTLKEVNGAGEPSFIILDIEKYKKNKYYDNLIDKLKKFIWNNIKKEDLDKIAEILRNYI
ncbi:beta barrel domain-containing protein [Clostridium sporogenes]|uniref:Uncharacterized protein n=2 Tax=Clostridium TaxID=1485 RepID=A0A6M0SXY4_CLOBO|nr:hypothetical protein [Clostridium sporogenes]NFA60377.1 hypothetical protein [Clostridium botulinum]APF25177.1 hypothetical protein NPD7_3996 [Clostridium sporogenes]APH16842.1 hypothetical protein NPD5_3774 [Clostridium sporogenes]NFI74451.1 hypothetical protein [Clostridium sporogenes]NFP62359.1 hypothetical protein [Clostridium sporogenes]